MSSMPPRLSSWRSTPQRLLRIDMKIFPLPRALGLALLAGIAGFTAAPRSQAAGAENAFPVTIAVDAAKRVGEMRPIWRFFGADEPNYATMKDGRRLLSELGDLRPG